MKQLLLSLASVLIVGTAFGDIQDPPMNDQGPTRKLGRALSNLMFGGTEIFTTVASINDLEGNSAAGSYGIVKGTGRFFFRLRAGLHELVTFPFPTYKNSFRPPYRLSVPWVNGGYDEFPPELGFQTRKYYCTVSQAY
jgi:putative exosortase-associated protein (TIGR04073 family)